MSKSLFALAATAACILAVGCSSKPVVSENVELNDTKPTASMTDMVSDSGLTTASFKVDGMTCGGCRGEVKDVLSKAPGVKDCTVEESGVVTVTFDEKKTGKEDLVATVNKKTDFKAAL